MTILEDQLNSETFAPLDFTIEPHIIEQTMARGGDYFGVCPFPVALEIESWPVAADYDVLHHPPDLLYLKRRTDG